MKGTVFQTGVDLKQAKETGLQIRIFFPFEISKMSLGRGKFIACVLVMAIQLIAKVPGLKSEVFAVGGAAGWTVPHKGMVNYTEWAAMLSSLNVGDTLCM